MRRLLLLVSVAAIAIFSNPTRAQFCPGAAPWVFDDVPAGDLFCGYITWAAQNGITLGCAVIDANHRLYCPNDAVTRSQMAAFVNRLGNVRVEAVGTGPGLTGGPITSVGTINLAATNLLPTVACATNQIPKWNGSAWVCSTDANSGGTVTSVGSGTGLAGGPITASGSLSIAAGYQLPQGCTNGQVAKSNGSNVWTCASDANAGGTVTSITAGNGLTGGTITSAGTIAVDPASTTLTGNFFRQGGNALGTTAVLGTTDNNALDIRANGSRVMRFEPNAIAPNVIGGSPANSLAVSVRGATIAGGGALPGTDPLLGSVAPNRVTDYYGTVGGGHSNLAGQDSGVPAGNPYATVAGGMQNTASSYATAVGGGASNIASGSVSVVAGGLINSASGGGASVGGGDHNVASGPSATVAGGSTNVAGGTHGTVGGGFNNAASGSYSTIGGGANNVASGIFSWAGGRQAKTQTADAIPTVHHRTFVFSSGAPAGNFRSEADATFNVLAEGGVRLVTAASVASGEIVPENGAILGNDGMLAMGLGVANVYGPKIGIDAVNDRIIGNQASTMYFRTNSNFAWYLGGAHSDTINDPGAGGSVLATLRSGATSTTVTGTFRALAFTATSDRDQKSDLVGVDGTDILAKVVSMPISTWSYKAERDAGFRHIGPTAQDFRQRFAVGYDDKSIATVDADGVALAAIQGLNAKVEVQARELEAQRSEIAELKRAIQVLMARDSSEGRVASR